MKLRRFNVCGTFLRCPPESKSKAGSLRPEGGNVLKFRRFFNVSGTFLRCPPKLKSRARRLRYDADRLLFLLSYKATSVYANSFFIPSHLPLEYSHTHPHVYFIMKYLATIFSLVALIALVPALVAADDGESTDSDDWSGDRHHPHHPRPPPQVLWGQCTFILNTNYLTNTDFICSLLGGGYYYTGTNVCPEGAYCRYFSDCEFLCHVVF